MPTEKHHYAVSGKTGKWTIIATVVASAMVFIDATALNVILPSLQKDLNATGTDLFWVLNSYLLMLASLIIVGGSMGDKLGRVRVFIWGILIFSLGSALCGISASIEQLIIFRMLQGLGGAMMIPGSLSILSATFKREEKGKAIGTWSAVTTIVTISGPLLGGALADLGLWRLIFFINVPFGVIAALILNFKVPESKESGTDGRVDLYGAAALASSLALITFGFLKAPEAGWHHPISYLPVCLGLITSVIFIWLERRIINPMVPLDIFLNKRFSGVNVLTFFLYSALGAMMLFLPLNLIQVQGYSQFQAGLTFLPFSLMMATSARHIGRISDRIGSRKFLIIGPFTAGVGFFMLAFIQKTTGPSQYWTTYFPGFIVFSLGMALTVVPLTTTVMNSVDDDKAGIASGINNSVTRIAHTFVNAILGAAAVAIFISYVDDGIASLGLNAEVARAVLSEAINLGEASVPKIVPDDKESRISDIFDNSFIETYRIVGIVSGALAILSSLVATFTVKNYKNEDVP